jgi:glucoside 3-dehydrogenase (cytochrome c) hitch-hiker subunit
MDISKNVDMNQAGIDRREAIKRVSVLFGGLAFGGSGLLNAVETAHARAAAIRQVGTFTAQDIALLDEIADTILPETKTPGAKAAHTGAFMALMVTDTYDDRNQTIFRDGLKKLNDGGFMTATSAQRLTQLEQLDREQKAYMDARERGAPPHFFRLMKELALLGYFTSEIGCSQAMRYRETPGRFDPCVPYTPGETTWAGHA